MSWLSKATGVHISPHGAHLSRPDPIGTLKDVAHNPLPLLGLAIPGVGSALGGLLGAIPGVGAIGGALGSAAGGVGTALSSIPGVGGLLGGASGAIGGAIPDEAMGGGGGLGGLLKGAEGWLTGSGGKNAIGLAQGINGILDQKKSENYGKDALGAATGAYNAAAPLRAQGIQGMLNPQTADLSGLQGIAGGLTPPNPGTNQALQAQLAQLHAPQASPASTFTPPTRKAGTSVASALKDPGNPYARAS